MRGSIVTALVVLLLAPSLVWARARISICTEPTGGLCVPGCSGGISLAEYYVVYVDGPPIQHIAFSIPKPTGCYQSGLTPLRLPDVAVFPNTVGDSETGVVVDFGECLSPPIHVLTLQFFCQGYEQLSRACCPWWFENLDAVSCGEAITWWGDFGSLTDGLSCHPFEAPHSPTPADSATGVPLTQLFYWSAGPEPVGCELGDVYVFMFSWGTGPENMTTLFDWGPGAYIPEGMLPNTRYYWQVASSSYNGAGPYWGPLWTFTTWGATPVETSTWGRIKALYE